MVTRRASDEQLNEILATPLFAKFRYIEGDEVSTPSAEDATARKHVDELEKRIDGFMGHMFGVDGRGGAFDELKDDMKHIVDVTEQTQQEVRNLCNLHKEDMQTVNHKLDMQKKDIDNIGGIARNARDKAEEAAAAKGRGAREFWGKVVQAAIPIMVMGAFTLLVLGIRSWVAQ